jgi:hypothetical protein
MTFYLTSSEAGLSRLRQKVALFQAIETFVIVRPCGRQHGDGTMKDVREYSLKLWHCFLVCRDVVGHGHTVLSAPSSSIISIEQYYIQSPFLIVYAIDLSICPVPSCSNSTTDA